MGKGKTGTKWKGTTFGNGWMHKWLIRMLKVVDVRFFYWFCGLFIIPPTVLFNSKSRKPIYKFYREGFGFTATKSMWMTLRNHYEFSKVVIDKFAMFAGKRFKVTVDGLEEFNRLEERPEGFILLSSHIGNYELAGYSFHSVKKPINALVFGGEKESVMRNRGKIFESNNVRMIPVGDGMDYLFAIDKALNDGEILGIPADRVFGSQKVVEMNFLGNNTVFPRGPFTLSVIKKLPTLFLAAMKTSAGSYRVIVKRLDFDSLLPKRSAINNLAEKYVKELEATIKEYPLQWYNYFEFWK